MNGQHRRDMYLLLAAGFFYFAGPMAITPLITGFTGSLGAGAALMGLAGGLMNITSFCCRPFVGAVSDRVRKYTLSLAGAACLLAAGIIYAAAWSPAVVLAGRVINGVGFALCSISISTWFSLLLPKEHMGAAMGLYGTMNALSMAIAPAAGIFFFRHFGYRWAFALSILCAAAVIVIIHFVSAKDETLLPRPNHFLPDQLVYKDVLPAALMVMMFTIPYCATQSFLVQYLEMQGLSFSAASFFPAYAVSLVVLRITLRDWFDRLPFSFFFAAACACMAGAICLLSFMDTLWEMLLAAVFIAGSYGVMCSVCQALAIVAAADGKRGLANSTYYIGIDLGMALGPLFGGLLFGAVPVSWFYPAFLAVLPAAAAVFLWGRRLFMASHGE